MKNKMNINPEKTTSKAKSNGSCTHHLTFLSMPPHQFWPSRLNPFIGCLLFFFFLLVGCPMSPVDPDTNSIDTSKDFNTLREAGNWGPSGIWSDGQTMWVSDISDAKLYAYDLTTKARVSSKDFNTLSRAGNRYPRGIWSDGQTMWVSDYTDDKLYAYDLETKVRVP